MISSHTKASSGVSKDADSHPTTFSHCVRKQRENGDRCKVVAFCESGRCPASNETLVLRPSSPRASSGIPSDGLITLD
uniref:Uncharacterized protein n=1 Tax=Steinernema glaseri TaxID=37863 RepID=A0A1I7ZNQ3_9BILA